MLSIIGLIASRIFNYWREYQVELHGKYSVRRLDTLHTYSQRSGMLRVPLLYLFTPVPCVALLMLMDVYRLADPHTGAFENYVFWVRSWLSISFMTIGILEQFRNCLPRLPLPNGPLLAVTASATSAGVTSQILLSLVIGFPLPFGLLLGTFIWAPTLVFGCYSNWKKVLKRDPKLVEDIAEYLVAFLGQIIMTIIYPLYIYVFTSLSGLSQNAFVIVLALIKIFLRNWISKFLHNMDDLKPEVLIFNIEVFNALYVSCSLQSSTSTVTTIVVMAIDFVQGAISYWDLNVLDLKLQRLMAKIPRDAMPPSKRNMMDISAELLREPRVRNHPTLALKNYRSFMSRRETVAVGIKYAASTRGDTEGVAGPIVMVKASASLEVTEIQPKPLIAAATPGELVRPMADTEAVAPAAATTRQIHDTTMTPPKADSPPLQLALTLDERAEFVRVTSNTLFLTEFVGLVEFTELLMPVIYTMYLVGMSRLPNRQYYPRLAALSDAELRAMIGNVLTYAGLEMASFVLFTTVIYRKFKFSPVHQVAFVLEKQMPGVQTKLVLWTFYVVQCMLFHSGVDFSMQFEWLKTKP